MGVLHRFDNWENFIIHTMVIDTSGSQMVKFTRYMNIYNYTGTMVLKNNNNVKYLQ